MYRKISRLTKTIIWIVIIIVTIWMIFPFIWAITTSFKTPSDVYQNKFVPFIQFIPTLEHWFTEIKQKGPEIFKGLKNSFIVASVSSLLALCLGTMAGYSLTRVQFRKFSNTNIMTWLLSLRMLVPVIIVIPYFFLLNSVNLIDTRVGLIILYTTFNLPIAILIMRDFIKEVPIELEDSALVDGCSVWSTFFRIDLPLLKPGLATTFILCFAFSWNEFLFALSLTYRKATTIPIIIMGAESTRGIEFWYISVRSLLAIIPPLILVLFVQRYIIRGLTMGAVKG
ncbi:MAG: carbohydrate ABC transporter permease [Kosmotoga sp.]|nr:MAG: carbohydrate ABC transporter permease [Kosmotoga sp.]